MTFFLIDNSFKIMPRLKKGLTFLALCCSIPLFAALTPIPVPPDIVIFCGNPLRVDEYIDSLDVRPHSDLAHVICELPVDAKKFIEALDKLHPALLQDLTLLTNENMQTVRQTFLGRNSFLRFDKCQTFNDCLYGDCNLGPSVMWFTPFGNFVNQTHIDQLHGYRSSTPGIMLGVDSQPNKNTVLGFGLGYSYSDLHWKKGYGTADCSTGYFGVYGSSIYDHFYVDAAVLGSYSFYKTVRNISFTKFLEEYEDFYCDNREKQRCKKRNRHHRPNCETPCESGGCARQEDGSDDCCCRICQLNGEEGEVDEACCRRPPPPCRCGIDREARSRFRGYGILSHIGIGGKLTICGLDIIPFGSVDYNFVDQDGHDEHQARSLNLRIKANHAHLLRVESGITLKGCIPYNCAWFRPSFTISYIRKQVLQGDRFEAGLVNYNNFEKADFFGSRKPLGYVCPGFGLEVQTSSQYIISFNYDAELNRQQITQRLTLRFQRAY